MLAAEWAWWVPLPYLDYFAQKPELLIFRFAWKPEPHVFRSAWKPEPLIRDVAIPAILIRYGEGHDLDAG